ncbi:MAG: NAD-dependent epimerase/dehydratase family protein [Candidatus Taylorbacteria bacterium]|nr:NAD-dependent epimerase/dehydratase family protein [Candidatus Taylorbacteria bacterium]
MHRILITGGSGYVGAMLVREFSARKDVEGILAIDKEPASELYAGEEKVSFVQANLCEADKWVGRAREFAPDIVIHTAWQIREMYGKKDIQWKWNVDGSDAVFDFALSAPSVQKLVHFSTVASYGAFPDNEVDHLFKESEGFRKTDYLYAEEKRIVEERLEAKYAEAKKRGGVPQVFVVRPAAITGPRGRYMRIRFGLQAALSGQLKENFIHRLVSAMVSFVPVTKKWLRQFIHEDDVVDIVALLSFKDLKGEYEAFNICPPGPSVRGRDMAEAVGKKAVPIHPYLIRIVFFFMWHASRGKVPTSKGGWKSYSYPIAVDGSKITEMYGYRYKFQPKEAFVKKEGRYMEFVR